MVDRSTESEINDATGVKGQKMQSDTLETLVWLSLFWLYFGAMPLLFKADIESAFRKCPVKPGHFQFAAVVFTAFGKPCIAEQRVCPVGAVASVWSFHRLVMGFCHGRGTHLHLVVCQYVDDHSGILTECNRTPATRWMEIVSAAFGLPLDGKNSEYVSTALVIFGAKVVVSWMKRGVRLSLSEEKIKSWSLDIFMALETMVLTPLMAEKLI